MPAGDLERLVIDAIADRLRDHELISEWTNGHSAAGRAKILSGCLEIANCISSEDSKVAARHSVMIQKVELSKASVSIQIDKGKLLGMLGIQMRSHDRDGDTEAANVSSASLTISVRSHLVRSGKQVKLILGNEDHTSRKVNEQLVEMIAKSRRWYEGLTSGEFLMVIAKDEGVDKSHVSRLLSVAFLAPDIVERILIGDQAATLTPERLRKACPLPVRWEDQQAMLLD